VQVPGTYFSRTNNSSAFTAPITQSH